MGPLARPASPTNRRPTASARKASAATFRRSEAARHSRRDVVPVDRFKACSALDSPAPENVTARPALAYPVQCAGVDQLVQFA